MTQKEHFAEWCVLELMGHRRLAGFVSEQEIAGSSFLRLDVYGPPEKPEPLVTQFYSATSVYCITPTTEDIARQLGARSKPAPVSRFELEYRPPGEEGERPEDDDKP